MLMGSVADSCLLPEDLAITWKRLHEAFGEES